MQLSSVLKTGFLSTGRIIYAVAILGFGTVCLVYVEFLNSLQPVPASLPGHDTLAILTGIIFAITGLALLVDRQVSMTMRVLAAMFALAILLLHIPSAFTNPELLRSPWWIRTFESLALGGAALVLAGMAHDSLHEAWLREAWIRSGRILFGISLPVFGVLHFIYADFTATLIPAWYPWPLFLAYLTGAGHFMAGVAIAFGTVFNTYVNRTLARWAAILAGGMYAIWALTLHLPRIFDNPPTYSGDRRELTSMFVCVAFWGAAWIVAGSVRDRE